MSDDGSIISKEQVSNSALTNFGIALSIARLNTFPSVQVQAFCGSPICMLQEQEEKDPKEGERQNAALFDPALDVKGLRDVAFILHHCLHAAPLPSCCHEMT